MKNIAILTYDGASLFELACAVELFCLPRPEFEHWYQAKVISFDEGLHQVTGNVLLCVDRVTSLTEFDMLIIPSWPIFQANPVHSLVDEIKAFSQQKKPIYSFCSGAFLLAELGLLDDQDATTHWRYADTFKQRFPQVRYKDDVLYVFNNIIGCSAGSAAAIDLGIEIIRQDFGYAIANKVARRFVMSAHRKGGQSQFVETPLLEVPNQFSQALDWAVAHLSSTFSINQFALKAGMSRRTFDRKFHATFNLTAKHWLTQQRLNQAKNLLENESYSIEKVAECVGFDNAVTMRHHFKKQLGISPSQYRLQFSHPTIHNTVE